MNISKILNVLLAIALVALIVKTVFFPSHGTAENSNGEQAAMHNILSRTSIRSYIDKDVEPEKAEQLLRAAMAAPSAGNKQPWKFIVIRDKEILGKLSSRIKTMKMVETAPLAIVVCGDIDNTFPGDGRDYWVEDASAASENILLAANALGLGAVWCGVYPMTERVAFIKEVLDLPENIVPLNVIPVGYPSGSKAPMDKWKPENIHYDTW